VRQAGGRDIKPSYGCRGRRLVSEFPSIKPCSPIPAKAVLPEQLQFCANAVVMLVR